MRSAWANAVALRSEKSVGCTIERSAVIAIAYSKIARHATCDRAAPPSCIRADSRGELAHARRAALAPELRFRFACRTASGAWRDLGGSRSRCNLRADERPLAGRAQTARISRRGQPASGADDVLSRRGPRSLRRAFRYAVLHQSRALQGRGSNGLYYAWFAEFLAARGYVVAALNHYRANTYDSTIAYLANKLWQRPRDISLTISLLIRDPFWGGLIDERRIGVAGHSQGGFTALWVAGAKINPEKYLAFQRGWRTNQMVPDYLRSELPLDASPALDVHDERVKAAFAMAPGIVQAFGMDEAGLRQFKVPAYITVGAADTQAPPAENGAFAARYAERAELHVIPGRVDHDIFVNECSETGRNEFPQACIDAPGVDRGSIHAQIGQAAVRFFNASLKVTRGK